MAGRLLAAASAALLLVWAAVANVPAAETRACGTVGTWLDPGTGKTLAVETLMAELAQRPIVLLGEIHENAEHHRWQLQTLAALHAHKPDMIVGFEMFPRRIQPVLDRWTAGALDVRNFLREAEWDNVWGFDPGLYLPLFHFVRQNRLSAVALNVDRTLTAKVGREGWAALPADSRAGLSDPAPASQAYLRRLAEVYVRGHRAADSGSPEAEKANANRDYLAEAKNDDRFKRFVDVQLTWDRAMAEALADARRKRPATLVVGIVGQGHAKFGHGIPHQLNDLGIPATAVVLPVDPTTACEGLPAGIADAVFLVSPPEQVDRPRPKPRLGIRIEGAKGGVRITQVIKNSVAEASKLAAGDIVLSAAGQPVEKVTQLIAIVQSQSPGTWLPLVVRRNGRDLEIIAKFPAPPPTRGTNPQ